MPEGAAFQYRLSTTVANPITLALLEGRCGGLETSIQSTVLEYLLVLLNTAHNASFCLFRFRPETFCMLKRSYFGK